MKQLFNLQLPFSNRTISFKQYHRKQNHYSNTISGRCHFLNQDQKKMDRGMVMTIPRSIFFWLGTQFMT